MPPSMWKPAVVAAALTLAFVGGVARAQDFETEHPSCLDPNQPHPVLHALHIPVPLGCWASHNGYSCGSARSEAVFIFGSCRQFFGEPCLKGPPPPPWSPAANYPPGGVDGRGADGYGRKCNCGDW